MVLAAADGSGGLCVDGARLWRTAAHGISRGRFDCSFHGMGDPERARGRQGFGESDSPSRASANLRGRCPLNFPPSPLEDRLAMGEQLNGPATKKRCHSLAIGPFAPELVRRGLVDATPLVA